MKRKEIELIRTFPDKIAKEVYYMNLAIAVSKRSTCLDKQVGAVLVDNYGKIISSGFNGAPSGFIHCTDTNHCHKDNGDACIAVHAEANAIAQAGREATGCTLYVTHSPCLECTKLILNAKILQVVALEMYSKHKKYPKLCPDMLFNDTKTNLLYLKPMLNNTPKQPCFRDPIQECTGCYERCYEDS